MRKPGTDEHDVKMSDVLCDFCHREWTEDVPMIEGHRGSCLCGRCLSVACAEIVHGRGGPDADYTCTMCLEAAGDRAALGRGGEPGWRSPLRPEAAVCRRCVELAAKALEKDPDSGWTRPG